MTEYMHANHVRRHTRIGNVSTSFAVKMHDDGTLAGRHTRHSAAQDRHCAKHNDAPHPSIGNCGAATPFPQLQPTLNAGAHVPTRVRYRHKM